MKKTSPQNQTEQTLDRFRQGDSEAFASLYHVHWQQVFRFSRLYLKSDDDAEDVVQEVFIRLWRSVSASTLTTISRGCSSS